MTRVLVNISRQEVSLIYVDGNGNIVPSPAASSVLPLRSYSLAAGSPLNRRIIGAIDERVKDVCGNIDEASRLAMPLILNFDNGVTQTAKEQTRAQFAQYGFGNIREVAMDEKIAEYFRNDPSFSGTVVVDSDGVNVYVSLALDSQPGAIARISLNNLGRDPRVEKLAWKIWEDIGAETIDLKFEDQRETLENAVRGFLQGNAAEIEDSVRLSDGRNYDFILNRGQANSVETDETARLQSEFSGFLAKYNAADRSRLVIVLTDHAIGNEYIRRNLTQGFKRVGELKDSLLEAVVRHIDPAGGTQAEAAPLQPEPEKRETLHPKQEPVSEPKPASTGTFFAEKVNLFTQTAPEKPKQEEPVKSGGPANIEIKVSVEKKGGLFKKKTVTLKIVIDSTEISRLAWKSVLIVQEKPLSTIDPRNVVEEYSRGDTLPFYLDLSLPLKQCPDARKLRIYFKPDPDEPVNINQAYVQNAVTIDVD